MLTALRRAVKHALLERWRMPHSPIPGVPPVIYRHFRRRGPVTLADVGAHWGCFTRGVEKLCGVAHGVLIEPIPELAQRLSAEFSRETYTVFGCAVLETAGEMDLNVFPEAPDMSSVFPLDHSVEDMTALARGKPVQMRLPVRTLDELMDEAAMEGADLVKIDVQGAEHRVLQGATRTLARTRAVYTEVSFRPLYRGSPVFSDIYALMRESGFRLVALESGYVTTSGELLQADALFFNSTYKP